MKPKISIIGEHQSKNIGDQAISAALVKMLADLFDVNLVALGAGQRKQPHALAIAADAPLIDLRAVIRLIPVKLRARVRWYILGERRRFSDSIKLSTLDSTLLIVGGGQLVKNNIALFCDRISTINVISKGNNLQCIVLGVGVDRRMSAFTWWLVSDLLRRSQIVLVRDERSRNRIEDSLDVNVKCRTCPDLVFSLSNPHVDFTEQFRSDVFALNVMCCTVMLGSNYNSKHMTVESIRESFIGLAENALANGKTVVLFTSGSREDLAEACRVKDAIQEKLNLSLEIFHPPDLDALLMFLSRLRFVFASRMHVGILSYISGCNPVCMNWDDKVLGVWSLVSEEARVLELKDMISDDFASLVALRFSIVTPPSRDVLLELAKVVKLEVCTEVERAILIKRELD